MDIVDPFQIILEPRDSIIEINVSTSPILGTLCSVKVSKKSHTAINGKAAFFDHDIFTVQQSACGQLILSIGVYFIH